MYPSTIYSQANPTENTFIDDTGFFLDVIIGYLNDNVTAIENKLGVDGSAITTSIDYLLKNPLSIDSGHKHTTSSINLTTDQLFVTAAEKVVIGNTSGVNTGNQVLPVKASGAEVNTGTDDAKFATPKAIADSYLSNGYNSLYRQAIINGNFDIWQRAVTGTDATTIATSLVADRWNSYRFGWATNNTNSRQDGTGVYGSQYCLRSARDSGDTSTAKIFLVHNLESSTSIKFRGKKATLSFWARKGANFSAASDKLVAEIVSGTGTDENDITGLTGPTQIATADCTLTTSWQKFTITTSAVVADTVNQLVLRFNWTPVGTAGAADYFEVTQVQLCAGDVALPFMPKSFEEELRMCQRYCRVFTSSSNNIMMGSSWDATHGTLFHFLSPPMRITPAITATAAEWRFYSYSAAAIALTAISIAAPSLPSVAVIEFQVASGMTPGWFGTLFSDVTGNRKLILSAEL